MPEDGVEIALLPRTGQPTDRAGRTLDSLSLRVLLGRIITEWAPEQIWLFGSRARGDAGATSDWDLFVVVPDDLEESQFDPLAAWRFRRQAEMRAHVVPCRVSDFREDRTTPNTLVYEVTANGVLLYER